MKFYVDNELIAEFDESVMAAIADAEDVSLIKSKLIRRLSGLLEAQKRFYLNGFESAYADHKALKDNVDLGKAILSIVNDPDYADWKSRRDKAKDARLKEASKKKNTQETERKEKKSKLIKEHNKYQNPVVS